ncbi:recombinase family protein [Arthrobacter terricola]|uniref:recombinase family protein n=1 Tax=Arthrobacter terricola TaxID=2547396 RepID=UPI0022A6D530|nr:recombinase family protein [Arthrobacter terricola]
MPNKEQAVEVLKAVRTIINGGSIGSIVNDLNGRGVATSRGGHWTSTAVRNMVMRSTNAGIAMHKGKETGKSEFPPIVSENEWRTAARIVKDPSRRTQFDARIKHMLAGLILCGQCEARMKISSRSQSASATNRNYYKCPTKGGGHAFQTAAPLEEFISDVVVSYLQQPGSLALFGAPAERDELERMTELQQQAVTLRERLDGYYEEAAKTGSPSPAALAKIESSIFAELEKIESQMSHARGAGILAGVAPDEIPQWWNQASVEKRRMVIEDRMVIHIDPVRKAAPRVFDKSRVRIDWKTYAV